MAVVEAIISGRMLAKPIMFVLVARTHTSASLATAKGWLDEYTTSGKVKIPAPDEVSGRALGAELLAGGLAQQVQLVIDGVQLEPIPVPLKSARFVCPTCGQTATSECSNCGWLRYPGDGTKWNKSGPCPKCGFAYRWDGASCSHCGLGANEIPPTKVVDLPDRD